MPYQPQLPKVRRSALRYVDVNTLVLNQRDTYNHLAAHHTAAGRHNDVRVPRVVALVRYTAGVGYALEAATDGVVLTNPSTGVLRLAFPAELHNGLPHLVRATPAEGTSPWLANYQPVGNHEVEVRLFKGGDGWLLANGSVAVAVHSPPVPVLPDFLGLTEVGFTAYFEPLRPVRTWAGLADNSERLREAYMAEHNNDGSHKVLEVARAVGRVRWTGSAYALEDASPFVSSVTRVSAGVVRLGLVAGSVVGTPSPAALVAPKGAAGEDWTAGVPLGAYGVSGGFLTQLDVHLLKRTGADAWTPTDGDFHFTLHGAS